MDRPVVAVVLAGGTGTRMYPASRSDRPKQFLNFGGDRSLLVRTLERTGLADHRVVLTGERHAGRTREHLAEASVDAEVWVEPEPKDTGPALAYAVVRARERFEDPVLVNLPSDHHVEGDFPGVAQRAVQVAVETRGLVALGIEPDRPATGYGYLEPGRTEDGYAPVRAFHEKPGADRARELIHRGCLWNAGIFVWTAGAFLDEARESPLQKLVECDDLQRGFAEVDPVSVDYAVMERTDHAFVVPTDLEWDDLGTWDALDRILASDDEGNTVLGEALTLEARDCVIASEDKHVTAVGVDELVVAAFGDRVLVMPKEEAQRVREVVERLEGDGKF